MESNNPIWEDLEIDISKMFTDSETFTKEVYQVADELAQILKSRSSVSEAKTSAEKQAQHNSEAKIKASAYIRPLTDSIYEDAETMDLDEVYHVIQFLKKFMNDLDVTFHSRARNDMLRASPNTMDKKLAHEQYMKLRTAFDAFREFAKVIQGKLYAPLAPMSGNYGSGTVQSYPAYRYEGEVYQNYRAVAKKLGWDPNDFKNHQDLVDMIEAEGVTSVEVIQVQL